MINILDLNIKEIKEINFKQSQDGTFGGYIITNLHNGNNISSMKIEIPRLDASKGLDNLEILSSNSDNDKYAEITIEEDKPKLSRYERRHLKGEQQCLK